MRSWDPYQKRMKIANQTPFARNTAGVELATAIVGLAVFLILVCVVCLPRSHRMEFVGLSRTTTVGYVLEEALETVLSPYSSPN